MLTFTIYYCEYVIFFLLPMNGRRFKVSAGLISYLESQYAFYFVIQIH